MEMVLPTHYSLKFSMLYDFLSERIPSVFAEQFVFKAKPLSSSCVRERENRCGLS